MSKVERLPHLSFSCHTVSNPSHPPEPITRNKKVFLFLGEAGDESLPGEGVAAEVARALKDLVAKSSVGDKTTVVSVYHRPGDAGAAAAVAAAAEGELGVCAALLLPVTDLEEGHVLDLNGWVM